MIKNSLLQQYHSVAFLVDGDVTYKDKELVLLYNTNSKLSTPNIDLMVQVVSPKGSIWSDTIAIDLSKECGSVSKQYGELVVASNCDFTDDGIYKFKIKNLSDCQIKGIEELGIAVK